MKNSRRKFMERAAALAAAIGFSSWPFSVTANQRNSNMLVHQVYFWLKNPQNELDHAKLLKGLQTLLTIESIDSGHIGVPAATEARDVVDHSYAFSYNVRFKSIADHDSYQTDPVHLKFIEECQDLWSSVKVYDYNLV